MYKTHTLNEKIKLLLLVMGPILVTQVGLYAMNFIDTTMSGRAGAEDLAGVAIGSSLWVPILTGVSGILLALPPIISQLMGAEKKEGVSFYVIQSIYLSLAISLLVFLLGLVAVEPVLNFMALEEEVAYIAKHYLIGLAVGMVPLFMYNAIRGFIDSLGQTRVTMIITLLALPVNFLFNYLLIFGKAGFPELGGIGAGYASAATYWFILIVTIYFVHAVRPFKGYKIFSTFYRLDFTVWKELLLLGTPIGLTIFFETSIFSAVTLLMSQFSTVIIAAHQAAINFASLLYMLPMSMAFTLTIAVGYEIGGKRLVDAKAYTKIGMGLSVAMGLVACVIIYVLREPVSLLYTVDSEVAFYIQQFLIYSIFFQLSDAINTPIQGILRGYKDVNVPFILALVAFWGVGLPTGVVLANYTALGPYGYWVGLILGLAVCAACLAFRLLKIQRSFAVQLSNGKHTF
ncbi:MATE family efflux transporter [Salipaludibacillus agaradhaerens]|uniref:MATE family efflux transporter n=1 Tax=Salipaludibacillus agaradhaerens TaxID=76935 RepID=UPI002150DA39|nr:MATE family efflux transporter [Salipaludibacillus agaradhaerens]MCR6105826.1 MATE family efflux transporter [Salipaludibacillus agaradhaerens]MCR6117861.1 MATE family efflux transporter [Salipaludibacillus agaradhaerens]